MKNLGIFGATLLVAASLAGFNAADSFAQSRRSGDRAASSSRSESARSHSSAVSNTGRANSVRANAVHREFRASEARPAARRNVEARPVVNRPAANRPVATARPVNSGNRADAGRPSVSGRPVGNAGAVAHPGYRPNPGHRPEPHRPGHHARPAYRPSHHHFCIFHPRPAFGVRYVRHISWPAPIIIHVSGIPYYYDRGVFYVDRGNEYYQTIVPPVGAIVPQIPEDYTIVMIDGYEYYQVDRTLYKFVEVNGEAAFEVVGQLG